MPRYERGDYVKVEFQDEITVISEWMWVRVHHCDDEKQLVFGTVDKEPVDDNGGKVEFGSEVVVSYSQIREHRKDSDFTSKNWAKENELEPAPEPEPAPPGGKGRGTKMKVEEVLIRKGKKAAPGRTRRRALKKEHNPKSKGRGKSIRRK